MKTYTYIIDITNINGEVERHFIESEYDDKKVVELYAFIKLYMDDEASGELVNMDCKFTIIEEVQ